MEDETGLVLLLEDYQAYLIDEKVLGTAIDFTCFEFAEADVEMNQNKVKLEKREREGVYDYPGELRYVGRGFCGV